MKIYLDVPYEEKDQVKRLGARWDSKEKSWYCFEKDRDVFFKWSDRGEVIYEIIGEDRHYQGDSLYSVYVDLIPESCWFTNVRSCIERDDWNRLRAHVYHRSNNQCEACGSRSNLEAHERWSYDIETSTQKLMRIIALCKLCHTVTHFGLAQLRGKGEEALKHLVKVNNLTYEGAVKHVKKAFELWGIRNKTDWKLDLSILEINNIKVKYPDDKNENDSLIVQEKINIKHKKIKNNIFHKFKLLFLSNSKSIKKQIKIVNRNRLKISYNEAVHRSLKVILDTYLLSKSWYIDGFTDLRQLPILGSFPICVIFNQRVNSDGYIEFDSVVNKQSIPIFLDMFMSPKNKKYDQASDALYESLSEFTPQLFRSFIDKSGALPSVQFDNFQLEEISPLNINEK